MVRSEDIRRCLFIHINKCAGTSVQTALKIPFNHETALEKLARLGPWRFFRTYRFAVVRNPWDRLASQYAHRIKMNTTGLGDRHLCFRDWVIETLEEKNPRYRDIEVMFQTQIHWLVDREGNFLVGNVVFFESLREGFRETCRDLGITAELPYIKSSGKGDYRDYYRDSQTIEIVESYFKDDIETFGYEFDGISREIIPRISLASRSR